MLTVIAGFLVIEFLPHHCVERNGACAWGPLPTNLDQFLCVSSGLVQGAHFEGRDKMVENNNRVAKYLILLSFFVIASWRCVRSEPKLPDAPIEWLELKVQAAKFSDTNVVYIAPSKIHGRGVMSARKIKRKGKIRFLQYFGIAL